jgi:type IV secretion system protein VirB5
MKPLVPITLAATLSFLGHPAAAQLVVHDPTSYASLIHQATTALDQLNELRSQVAEARRLYDGFNTGSGAGALAGLLKAPKLRAYLPEVDKYVAAAKGDLAALGEIGRRATEIRADRRLYAAAPDDALGQELERQGDGAARDLALGEAAAAAGSRRLEGLSELLGALDAAPNARAVMDLQARFSAEQAMTLNDQMRLQGLAMAQAAEGRLQDQRDRERAQAEADARIALFRKSFQ